jgi:hypothetical protein
LKQSEWVLSVKFYKFGADDSCPNDEVYAVSFGVTVCFHLKVKWSTAMMDAAGFSERPSLYSNQYK